MEITTWTPFDLENEKFEEDIIWVCTPKGEFRHNIAVWEIEIDMGQSSDLV